MSVPNNVLLVSLGFPYDETIERNVKIHACPPYGVLCLASYVNYYTKTNAHVDILDLCIENINEIECTERVMNNLTVKHTILGFSLLFNGTQKYLEYICKRVKQKFPELIIICGGGLQLTFIKIY